MSKLLFLKWITKLDLRRVEKLLRGSNKKMINRAKKYLLPGIYRSNVAGNIWYLEGQRSQLLKIPQTFDEFVSNSIDIKSKMFLVSDNQTKYKGTVILFSSSGKEIKIFDFYNNIIITCYHGKKRYETIKAKRQFFKDIFDKIPNLEYCDNECTIVEKRLESIPYKVESIFPYIVKIYCQYVESAKIKKLRFNKILNWFCKAYNIYFPTDFYREWPAVKTHGDLWSGNILLSEDKYYIIDFEYADDNWFAYDFFTLIIMEYQIKNDETLLRNFINGDYDSEIIRLFECVDEVYYPKFRKWYVLFFLACITYVRWKYNYEQRIWIYKVMKKYELV